MLCESVQWFLRNGHAIQLTVAGVLEQCNTLDQLVAGQRKQSPLGCRTDTVTGTADTLQKGRDGTWRSELTNQIDVADIDAELQRRRRDQAFELTALETLLGLQSMLFRQAAVVRRDVLLADSLGKKTRRALR